MAGAPSAEQRTEGDARLVEVFVVVGFRRDSITEHVTGDSSVRGPVDTPLHLRAFTPHTLAALPAVVEGTACHESVQALPPFCFPDGVHFARVSAEHLRVPRFSTFVLTRGDFSRLHGYALEFWEPAPASLAADAGAAAQGDRGWSLPTVICFLCRSQCARGMERLLRAIHAAHEAQHVGGLAATSITSQARLQGSGGGSGDRVAARVPVQCSIAHVVLNSPLPTPGSPPVVLHAAGAVATLWPWVAPGGLPPLDFSLSVLWRSMGPDALIALLSAILLERKVVFVASQHEVVGRAVLAACALTYPLVWQNVLVPLLPSPLLDMVHTPFPALFGLRLEQLLLAGASVPADTVWVHLDRGRVDGSKATELPTRERRWLRASLAQLLAVAASAGSLPTSNGAPRPEGSAGAPAVGEAAMAEAEVDARLQRLFAGCMASLLRDLDDVAPEDGGSGWRRTDREEAAIARALSLRPAADRRFFKALYDTQHCRALIDTLGHARSTGRLPSDLAGFMRIRRAGSNALFSWDHLPVGDGWFSGEQGSATAGELSAPAAVVVPQEELQPGRAGVGAACTPRDGYAWSINAAQARGMASTLFPLDLESAPAKRLPLPELASKATVPYAQWADDAVRGGAQGASAPALGLGQRLRTELVLRSVALCDDLAIDSQRYAEDGVYRAEVARGQTRATAAATAVAVGSATAGALLCSVQ